MIFKSQKDSTAVMMMPLRDIVVFPYMIVPLFVGRRKSIIAVEKGLSRDKKIFLCTQNDPSVDSPTEENIYSVGTLSIILQLLKLPDGSIKVLVEGKKRCRIKSHLKEEEYFSAFVEEIDDICRHTHEIKALKKVVISSFENHMKLNKRISKEMLSTVSSIENPGKLADIIAPQLNLKIEERQQLLETIDVKERLEGTLATVAYAVLNDVNIIRVHDVAEMKDVACVTDAIISHQYD